MFAWDRIDAASALLAAHLPADLRAAAPTSARARAISRMRSAGALPRRDALDLYEAEARALALARSNLAPFAGRAAVRLPLARRDRGLPRRYDFIVSNPPFHAHGRGDRPDIGRAFIAAAAAALNPGGRLWLVANRHLPYEAVLDANFGSVRTVAQQQGFKVIEAMKRDERDVPRKAPASP